MQTWNVEEDWFQAYVWGFNIGFRMDGLHTTKQMSVEMQMTVEKQVQPAVVANTLMLNSLFEIATPKTGQRFTGYS